MKKRTRRILFAVCLAFFLLVTPMVILYSQGYRFDIESKKITQAGGLFLKVWPKQAEVYLDSLLKEKTDWFFGSTLIENLIPKKYKILVKKEGFHPWEKVLEIKEKEVTTVENIVLIPKNLNLDLLTKGVEEVWFSPDNKKIILKTKNISPEEEYWGLSFYDIENRSQTRLIEEKDIDDEVDLLKLEFSSDSKNIFLKLGIKEEIKDFILDMEKVPPILTERSEQIFFLEGAVTYQKFNEEIYYLNNSGYLFKTNQSFDFQTRLTEIPLLVLPKTEYRLEKFRDFIFIQENKDLYWLNPESKSFEKFFTPIKGLEISPEYKKLAYFSDYEIWLLFLEEKRSQPQKRAGEQLFLVRLSEKIKDVSWLDSEHLIFAVGEQIKISEIDERDRLNITDIAQFKNPKIYFNNSNKKLYIFDDKNLYQSRELLP